jgi:exosortase A
VNEILWHRLSPAAAALGVAALVLGLLFHAEIGAAVHVWNTSTAYGHCWLIVPIALFLAYERHGQAAAETIAPRAGFALLAIPLIGMWLLADLLGIMEGRQLAVIGFLEVTLLAAFGWRVWWALAGALLYLAFLVPFGAFVTPLLQGFTTSFVVHGLNLLGIANRETGNTIEIPEGVFYIAEACAGLRFLIASIAFGVLYALTMFTSPGRRVAFVAASIIVPIVANALRALGIVVLGHALGSAQAAAADHVLYGWIFFSIVIAALAAVGMPFRQDAPPPPPPGPLPSPGTRMRVAYAVWPALLLAAAGPAFALVLSARTATPPAPAAMFKAPDGCTQTADHATPGLREQAFTCGSTQIRTRALILPRGANPSAVVEAAHAQAPKLLPNGDLDGSVLTVPGPTPTRWALDRDGQTNRAAATILFIDGHVSGGGIHDRLALARDMLSASGTPALILAVAVTDATDDATTALTKFITAQGALLKEGGGLRPLDP